jgi:hypothetical protein
MTEKSQSNPSCIVFYEGALWIGADFHLHTRADREFKYTGKSGDRPTITIEKNTTFLAARQFFNSPRHSGREDVSARPAEIALFNIESDWSKKVKPVRGITAEKPRLLKKCIHESGLSPQELGRDRTGSNN